MKMSAVREIAGRTALVTGANRGLGAALVEALLDSGAAKVYCGARDPSTLAACLARHGSRVEAITLDVTDTADVEAAAEALTDLDILVSSAGATYLSPLLETPIATARQIMETNYFGPLQLILAFAETLKRRKGGFIYILSLAGLAPAPQAEFYSASKAAGSILGHAVRHVLPDVAVSLSYPGSMDTDMLKEWEVPKTPPQDVARNTLEGWRAGEVAIFPDFHAQCLRDAVLTRRSELLTDPYALMHEALTNFLAAHASQEQAASAGSPLLPPAWR
jgi:NAD(P)-dependent dehydrogenase (short-subunit alcohol dehydrogenase family)